MKLSKTKRSDGVGRREGQRQFEQATTFVTRSVLWIIDTSDYHPCVVPSSDEHPRPLPPCASWSQKRTMETEIDEARDEKDGTSKETNESQRRGDNESECAP